MSYLREIYSHMKKSREETKLRKQPNYSKSKCQKFRLLDKIMNSDLYRPGTFTSISRGKENRIRSTFILLVKDVYTLANATSASIEKSKPMSDGH